MVPKVWKSLFLVLGVMLMVVVTAWAAAPEAKKEEAVAVAAEVLPMVGMWKTLMTVCGAMMTVVLTAMCTAYVQGKIGPAGCGAMAEKPEVSGTVFIMIAIPETLVVLGFVISAMIILMVK